MTPQAKEKFMQAAIVEAQKAQAKGEVPIGAVVVHEGQIIGRGHNLRESQQDSLAHAEVLAIREANRALNSWRLNDCQLFVTLEPCPMCTGAILNSRLDAVYYGASDLKAGVCGTIMNLLDDPRLNHQADVEKGICQKECLDLLQDFFQQLR